MNSPMEVNHLIKQQLAQDLLSHSSNGMKKKTNRSGPQNESVKSNYTHLLDLSNQGLKCFDDAYTTLIELYHEQKENQVLQFTHLDLSNNSMTSLIESEQLRKQIFSHYISTSNSSKSRKFKKKRSEVVILENVNHLNVLNNFEIDDIQDFVDQIVALMPEVTDLHISLSLEEDVSYIIDHMPKLDMLNGIKVEKDQPEEEEVDPMHGTFHNQESNFSQHPIRSGISGGAFAEGTMETIDAQLQQHLHKDILSDVEHTLMENSNAINIDDSQRYSLPQQQTFEARKPSPPEALSQAQANLPQVRPASLDADYILAQASKYAKRALASQDPGMPQRNSEYSLGDNQGDSKQLESNKVSFDQNLSRIYEQTDENLTSNFQNSKTEDLGHPDFHEFTGEAFVSIKEGANKTGSIKTEDNFEQAPQPKIFDYQAVNKSMQEDSRIHTNSLQLHMPDELHAEPAPKIDSKEESEEEGHQVIIADHPVKGDVCKDESPIDKNEMQATDGDDDSDQEAESQNMQDLRNIVSEQHSTPPSADLSHPSHHQQQQEQLSEIKEEDDGENEAQIVGQGLLNQSSQVDDSGFNDKYFEPQQNQTIEHEEKKPVLPKKRMGSPKHNFHPTTRVQPEKQQSPPQPKQPSARQILNDFAEVIDSIENKPDDILIDLKCSSKEEELSQILPQHNQSSQLDASMLKDEINTSSDIDLENPQLRPSDLEDLANVFDNIRVLYKKREESSGGKKLITKQPTKKIDEQAALFDKKLTEIMVKLSKVLKDPLITKSQKQAEIEKSKFLLNIFCMDTTLRFMSKNKHSLQGKEVKDIHWIISKLKEGFSKSFLNLGTLFYSKSENEVQEACEHQITLYREKITQQAQENADMDQELQAVRGDSHNHITELKIQLQVTREQLEASQNELRDKVQQCDTLLSNSKTLEASNSSLRSNLDRLNYEHKEQAKKLTKTEQELFEVSKQLRHSESKGRETLERMLQLENAKIAQEKELQGVISDLENQLKSKGEDLRAKTAEIDRLNQALNALTMEVNDKSQQVSSLNDENQKYLDMIIKYSLGGKISSQAANLLQNKQLRQQFQALKKGVKGTSNIFEMGSAIDNKSQLCPSSYGRSPLLPGQRKSGSLMKRKSKKKSQFDRNSQIGGLSLSHSPIGLGGRDLGQTEPSHCSPMKKSKSRSISKTNTRNHSITEERKTISPSPIKKSMRKSKKLDTSFDFCQTSNQAKSQNQMSQYSYDDLGQTAKKAKRGGLKSAHKNKSGTVTPSKSKTPKKSASPLKCAFNHATPVESHDGHKISMDDCEPSPEKVNQVSPSPKKRISRSRSPTPEKIIVPRQQTSGYKENSQIKKRYKEQQAKIGRLSIEKSREDLAQQPSQQPLANTAPAMPKQMVPQLQFNGIGFSFNEHNNLNGGSRPTEILDAVESRRTIRRSGLQSHHSRTQTLSPPTNSSQKKFITTKVLNNPHLKNQMLSTDPLQVSQYQQSVRSKSTPTQSMGNLHFVGGPMGNLPQRIQGTSDLPVASIQTNQANHIQTMIRSKLKETTDTRHRRQTHHVFDGTNFGTSNSVISPEFKSEQTFQPQPQPQLRNRRNLPGSVVVTTTSKRAQYLSSQAGRHSISGQKGGAYTLKQMKELIADIYVQKVKHDDKCVNQNHQSRETMEQYLYTYLNQKYGLKSLVKDQASAIIQGIANFQAVDHEVNLFGKVLRHEVDEEFRYVQLTIKSTIQQLLKTNLRDKHPSKSTVDITRMATDIQSGKAQMDYSIWSKIINHMYEPTDVQILQRNLRHIAQQKQAEAMNTSELRTQKSKSREGAPRRHISLQIRSSSKP